MKLRTIAVGLALAAGLALTLTPTGLASAAVKDGVEVGRRPPRRGHHQGRAAAGRGLLDARSG